MWLGVSHVACVGVGLGRGEAWTIVGGVRAGLVLMVCEVALVMLCGAWGSGVGALDWGWAGFGVVGVEGGAGFGIAGVGSSDLGDGQRLGGLSDLGGVHGHGVVSGWVVGAAWLTGFGVLGSDLGDGHGLSVLGDRLNVALGVGGHLGRGGPGVMVGGVDFVHGADLEASMGQHAHIDGGSCALLTNVLGSHASSVGQSEPGPCSCVGCPRPDAGWGWGRGWGWGPTSASGTTWLGVISVQDCGGLHQGVGLVGDVTC